MTQDAADGRARNQWAVARAAAETIVDTPTDEDDERRRATATRAAQCFGQQMLLGEPLRPPRIARRMLARLMTEATVP